MVRKLKPIFLSHHHRHRHLAISSEIRATTETPELIGIETETTIEVTETENVTEIVTVIVITAVDTIHPQGDNDRHQDGSVHPSAVGPIVVRIDAHVRLSIDDRHVLPRKKPLADVDVIVVRQAPARTRPTSSSS